jgi:hypothetical protein
MASIESCKNPEPLIGFYPAVVQAIAYGCQCARSGSFLLDKQARAVISPEAPARERFWRASARPSIAFRFAPEATVQRIA